MDAIEALLTRRSPVQLKEPAPAGAALDSILRAGIHAPDHGKLRPWRFILLKGEARGRFGEILAEAFDPPQPPDGAQLVHSLVAPSAQIWRVDDGAIRLQKWTIGRLGQTD